MILNVSSLLPYPTCFPIHKLVDKSKNNPKYSELFYEIRHETYSTAWEVYKKQLTQDIVDQVFMSVTAALLSAAVETIVTSTLAALSIFTLGTTAPAAILAGKAAGAATYLTVYTLMTKFNIDRKVHEAQSKERSETFYPTPNGVQEPVSLNEKSFFDRILQDSMAAALIGHPGGYYATVSGKDSGTTYTGQLLVSPPNLARMLNMFGGFLELLWENFWNAGESDPDVFTALDFDEQNLDFLLMTSELPYYNTKEHYKYENTEFLFDVYNQYSFNTLGALETQVREQTNGVFNAIRPTCVDGAPQYEFINSSHYETVLPQSILYRPVVLSQVRYDNINPVLGSLIVSVRCKDYGKTQGINAYQMNDVESQFYQAKVPLNDNGFEYPIQAIYIDVVQEEAFQNTYFAQNILVNESDYKIEGGNLYFTKSIEALISEKYPLFEDFLVQSWANELIDHTMYYNIKITFDRFVPDTTKETRRLALAQATSYTLMEYFNQYTYAEITVNMISEITYTETMTFWSTLISAPLVFLGSWTVKGTETVMMEASVSSVKALLTKGLTGMILSPIMEVFQEIIEDGFIEALSEGIVDLVGLPEDIGFWLSSYLTSRRELSGALGQLSGQGRQTALSGMFSLTQAIASGDMNTYLETLNQHIVQQQETAQIEQDQKSFWGKMLKTDLLIGIFMMIPSFFFGSFGFVALSGLTKITTSTVKLSPAAYTAFASRQHRRRKEATIEFVGTEGANSVNNIFVDAMKKASDLDGAKAEIDKALEGDIPSTSNYVSINPDARIESRNDLAKSFNTIAFGGYFNEWVEGYLLNDERFNAFKAEFKQIQKNFKEIGVQKAEKETIDIIKKALKGDNVNLRFINMFGVEFYDPDFTLIGAPLGSRATIKGPVLRQDIFKSSMSTLDKIRELRTIFDVDIDLRMFVISDEKRVYIPIDSKTNLADWLDDNNFGRNTQIFVEPTSALIRRQFSRDQALESFDSLVSGLKSVLSNLYYTDREFTERELSEFLGFEETYISNFRDKIKNKMDESPYFSVDVIFKMIGLTRARIIQHSNDINVDLTGELDKISGLFIRYLSSDNYYNLRENLLYRSLVEFQNSLAIIFNLIGEISGITVGELERKLSTNLRGSTAKVKKKPSTELNSRNFVKLYNTIKIGYRDKLKQHGLEQEFERVFFNLFKTFKDRIIRSEHKNTVRGRLLQEIIDLLPEDFYIDRNTFSKLIFGDEYYIMATYFHKDNLHSYPKTQTYNKIEKNIRSIKTDSINLYAGKPLSQTNLNDLKADILWLTKLYKNDYSSSKTTLPERVLRYYMEYLFGGDFEKDSAVSWLTTVGGKDGELDGHEKELNIAFEFNGPQHYKLSHWIEVYGLSESDAKARFNIQNVNDLSKLRECKERDTVLIVLSSLDDPSKWQDIIVHQYELWTGKKAPDKQQLSYEEVLRLISEEAIGTLKIKFLRNFSG